jgi:hypothetical protein
MKDEHELDLALHKIRGRSQAVFPWGHVEVTLDHINLSAGGRGSPDSLLLVGLRLSLFGEKISAQIPIAVEAEKAGIDAAIQDLDKFTQRSLQGEPSYLCLPMLVVTGSTTGKTKSEFRDIKARFDIKEVAWKS